MSDRETEIDKLVHAITKVGQSLKLPYSAMKGSDALAENVKDLYSGSRQDKKKKKKIPSPTPMPAKIKQMRADKARRDSKGADKTAPLEQMKYGGKVKGYQNGGCIMAGRGGKFKGIS